jgi:glycosyltransferase involved in cell wall biosynthesis
MRQVCLVVPCFNEERRLVGERFVEFLAATPSASICFVNDGSRDGTLRVLQALQARSPERILVQGLDANRGKAEAVRQGALHAAALARFAAIGYWDADLSTPLTEVDRLLSALDADPRRWLALGSRVKRLGSEIDRRASRHYLGRVFCTLSSQLLDLAVYDSQCGAKVFRAEATGVLFGERFVTKWLFDLELLVRLRKHLGAGAFAPAAVEVPLSAWREVGGSKLTLAQMSGVPLQLLAIRRHYLGG